MENQLGKFIFTQEREPDKVFIQIEGDGEAGYFNWVDVPEQVKVYLRFPHLQTKRDIGAATAAMIEFWKKHF